MADERSLAARMLDPKTQARAALEFSRLGSSSEEAATWAVAAAVFSLRDTVERAMMPAVVTGADPWHMTKNDFGSKAPEPDKSQLTPEEAAAIRRWTVYPHGPFPFTRTDMGFADQALADEARRTQDALNCARDLMSRDPASQSRPEDRSVFFGPIAGPAPVSPTGGSQLQSAQRMGDKRRTQADCPFSDADIETIRKNGYRPAVTREQVFAAIADSSIGCKGARSPCDPAKTCSCKLRTGAVMKLLEGGE